jgi:hypothetical protein
VEEGQVLEELAVRRIIKPALLALIVSFVEAGPALAYIDPNTGGMLFQILAVLFASLSAILLFFSRQVRIFLARVMRSLRDRLGGKKSALSEAPPPTDREQQP